MKTNQTLVPESAPPVWGLIYAGLIAVSTIRGYFHLFEVPWYATQLAYIAVIFLAAAWVFYSGETRQINLSLNVMLVQMLPGILTLVWSLGLWIVRRESLALIRRGTSMISYQLLVFVMLMGAGILFGKKALEYTSFGFLIANTLILLDVIRTSGLGATVSGMFSFLLSAGSVDNVISGKLEVQDLTFGIGILLVYYIVAGKGEHWRYFHIAFLGFYFILGFKRILFPAVAAGAAWFLLTQRMKRKTHIGFAVILGLILIAVSMVYVILIRSGIWVALCESLGIDLMGRGRLYGYMESYYQISPTFLGMGNGMVSTVLEVLEKTGNRRLHSDVLRMYIELGMPAFLAWCYLTFIFTFTHLTKRYSERVGGMYMAMTLLMFITFLTDNTLEKFCPEIAWHLLPLTMAFEEREQLTLSLHDKPLINVERTDLWHRNLKTQEKEENRAYQTEDPVMHLQAFREERRKNRMQ